MPHITLQQDFSKTEGLFPNRRSGPDALCLKITRSACSTKNMASLNSYCQYNSRANPPEMLAFAANLIAPSALASLTSAKVQT